MIKSEAGITLIEVLVAAIVGTILMVGAGNLGLNVFHQRATYDSLSAAMSLAERQWETLRAIQNPSTSALFTSGATHTAANSPMTETGATGGYFQVTWDVLTNTPLTGVRKITITVQHANNPQVRVQYITYYRTG